REPGACLGDGRSEIWLALASLGRCSSRRGPGVPGVGFPDKPSARPLAAPPVALAPLFRPLATVFAGRSRGGCVGRAQHWKDVGITPQCGKIAGLRLCRAAESRMLSIPWQSCSDAAGPLIEGAGPGREAGAV